MEREKDSEIEGGEERREGREEGGGRVERRKKEGRTYSFKSFPAIVCYYS